MIADSTPKTDAAPKAIPGLTPGRMVHFTVSYLEGQPQPAPLAGIVAAVHSADGVVTLTVCSASGSTFAASSVPYDPEGRRGYAWRFIPRA